MFIGYVFVILLRIVRGRLIFLKGDFIGKNFLYMNGNSVIICDIEVSLRFL